jgi:hypothetical protein
LSSKEVLQSLKLRLVGGFSGFSRRLFLGEFQVFINGRFFRRIPIIR